MKTTNIFGIAAVFLLFFFLFCSASDSPGARIVEKFNYHWKFQKADVSGAEAMTFDDTNWRKLNLPHDWSVEGPYNSNLASCTGYLPGGIAWYRKTFDVATDQKDKKIYV